MTQHQRPGTAPAAKAAAVPEPPKQPAPAAENGNSSKPYPEAPDTPKPVPDPTAAAYSSKLSGAAGVSTPPDFLSLNDVIKLAYWSANPTADPAEAAARRGEVREILLRVLDQIAPE